MLTNLGAEPYLVLRAPAGQPIARGASHHSGIRAPFPQSIPMMKFFRSRIAWPVLFLCTALPALNAEDIPFVGCKSDGQTGPVEAPRGAPTSLQIPRQIAQHLAYYSAGGIAVLGPRGWSCFSVYGSSGSMLYVVPESVTADNILLRHQQGFDDPAIELADISGQGSGGRAVVSAMARAFPAWRKQVEVPFAMLNPILTYPPTRRQLTT
jgi:hypothetical protein